MKNKDYWQYSVTLACLILGIFISLQFKAQKSKGFPLYKQRTEELVKIINGLEIERNKLRVDLEGARNEISDFQESISKGENKLNLMKKQVEMAKLEAGFIPLEGPGVQIFMNDSPRRPNVSEDPFYYIVHDIDLEALVNELKASGSEAISINGQRIVAVTAIRCAGPTIFINSERMTPPYIINAIGPSEQMETALMMNGGYMDSLSTSINNGVVVKLTRKDKLVVPSYKGSLVLRYAKEYKSENKEKKENLEEKK